MHTRRQFVTAAGAFTGAAVFAPQTLAQGLTTTRKAPRAKVGKFTDGIVSGDATPNGVTLWSRLDGIGGAVHAELEVATDSRFRHVVARKNIATNAALNHSLKARIEKLKPHEQYFYRFSTASTDSRSGASAPRCRPTPTSRCTSPSGPARTTPTASTTPTR